MNNCLRSKATKKRSVLRQAAIEFFGARCSTSKLASNQNLNGAGLTYIFRYIYIYTHIYGARLTYIFIYIYIYIHKYINVYI
jgi:hypothetical protein